MEPYSPPANLPTSAGFVDQLIAELASFHPEQPTNITAPGEPDPPRTQTTHHQPKQPRNALSRLSPSQLAKVKPLLLTLHCLFPNDLLPALDILDRRLVQRLVVRGDLKINAVPSASTQDQELAASPGSQEIRHKETKTSTGFDQITPGDGHASLGEDLSLFLVSSASSAPAYPTPASASTSVSTSTQEPQKAYEVRLNAWNCTCPTFTLSAFRDLDSRLRLASTSASTPIQPAERPTLRDRDADADADGGSESGSGSAAATAVYPFGGTLTCTTDRVAPPACKHILACVLFVRCPRLFGGGGEGRGVLREEVAGWCAGWGG